MSRRHDGGLKESATWTDAVEGMGGVTNIDSSDVHAHEIAELEVRLAESEKQRTELWEWCNTRITELEAANERLVREKTELWEWCEPQIRNAHPTVWSFTRSQLGALARRLKLR